MSDKKGIYKTLRNYCGENKENFFVSYALRGPMVVPSMGLESGLPLLIPIEGPVKEPSVLNTRWKYSLPYSKRSIL